jgi:sortase A
VRAQIGGALCIIGAGLLSFSGWTYTSGALTRDAVRRAWDEAQAASVREASLRSSALVKESELPIARGAPMARLVIPAIGLDEVVVEGVDPEQLNAAPGHLPGSAFPGDAGNAIISAHRDRHFHDLDQLATGDTVVTETADGRATWVVISRRVVSEGAPALFSRATPTLTLTTCWPLSYFGPAPDRLLITAEPLKKSVGVHR